MMDGVTEQTVWDVIGLYLQLGYQHILPKGLDHILFVLALFFASSRLKPLSLQISAFTLAHTLTLGLAVLGLITLSPRIVEPMIALSIAFVAVENLVFKDMQRWRPLVVFGFGLFHGLGFAGVLVDLGLPHDQLLPSLLSFNLGVEAGQLTIVLALWFALHRFRDANWYPWLAKGASALIAVIALWWVVERVFLVG
ncbi:HupE/UreJ family protein [uncultured Maricaulis sp.]|uniref:HupE/UreJ family protein n=1 Tax=uncultured Maricaulis sp. TaxID=174710 RepID=UPI0030DBD6A6|tara:strand:+ start:82156 stop:82743 length:588 start_codon:yes stop_codon:yes gene_type:complete